MNHRSPGGNVSALRRMRRRARPDAARRRACCHCAGSARPWKNIERRRRQIDRRPLGKQWQRLRRIRAAIGPACAWEPVVVGRAMRWLARRHERIAAMRGSGVTQRIFPAVILRISVATTSISIGERTRVMAATGVVCAAVRRRGNRPQRRRRCGDQRRDEEGETFHAASIPHGAARCRCPAALRAAGSNFIT